MSTALNISGIFGNHDELPTSGTYVFGGGLSIEFYINFKAIDLFYVCDAFFDYITVSMGTTTINELMHFNFDENGSIGDTITSIIVTAPAEYVPSINTTFSGNAASVQGTLTLTNNGTDTFITYLMSSNGTTVTGGPSPAVLGTISSVFNQFRFVPIFYPNFETVQINAFAKSPPSNLPGNPTNLQAFLGPVSYVQLEWEEDIEPGLLFLTMYRGNGLGTAFSSTSSIASVSPATLTAYLDTTTVYGGEYTYYLTATNSFGESGPSNAATITVPLIKNPNLVVPLSKIGVPRNIVYFSNNSEVFLPAVGVVDALEMVVPTVASNVFILFFI